MGRTRLKRYVSRCSYQRIGDANDVAAYEREDEGVIYKALYPGTDHAHDHHRPHIEAKRTVA